MWHSIPTLVFFSLLQSWHCILPLVVDEFSEMSLPISSLSTPSVVLGCIFFSSKLSNNETMWFATMCLLREQTSFHMKFFFFSHIYHTWYQFYFSCQDVEFSLFSFFPCEQNPYGRLILHRNYCILDMAPSLMSSQQIVYAKRNPPF